MEGSGENSCEHLQNILQDVKGGREKLEMFENKNWVLGLPASVRFDLKRAFDGKRRLWKGL